MLITQPHMYTYAFHTRQAARMPPKKKEEEVDRLTRIAIVNKDKCKPKKCRQVRLLLRGGWWLECVEMGGLGLG